MFCFFERTSKFLKIYCIISWLSNFCMLQWTQKPWYSLSERQLCQDFQDSCLSNWGRFHELSPVTFLLASYFLNRQYSHLAVMGVTLHRIDTFAILIVKCLMWFGIGHCLFQMMNVERGESVCMNDLIDCIWFDKIECSRADTVLNKVRTFSEMLQMCYRMSIAVSAISFTYCSNRCYISHRMQGWSTFRELPAQWLYILCWTESRMM